MPTAAAIIIGNEILTGKFADENGPYLIGRLRTLGADLRRVVTIPDEVDVIAREVADAAARHDVVFTSGGVGPTHDDVTLEGVAAAFDLELEVREELLEIMRKWDVPIDDSTRRMAAVPAGTTILHHGGLTFPVVLVRNVYVLPGIPKLFQHKFENIADRFAGDAVKVARIYSDERETAIASRVSAVAARHPDVDIGSYPRFGEGPYHVILTLESRDAPALERAYSELSAVVSVVDLAASVRR